MLNNRFVRLLVTIVSGLALYLISGSLLGTSDFLAGILGSVLITYVLWAIFQFYWDLLDGVPILPVLLHFVFFGAAAFSALIALMLFFAGEPGTPFGASPLIAVFLTFILAILAENNDWEFERGYYLPLISLGISLVGGLIVSLLGGAAVFGGIAIVAAGIIAIVAIFRSEGGISLGDSSMPANLGGKSTPSSRTRPSQSGNNYSSSGNTDYRQTDGSFFSAIEREMHRIANNHSSYRVLSYGLTASPQIYVSTSNRSVEFRIDVSVSGGDFTESYQIDNARSELNDYLQDLINDLCSAAESEIDDLRSRYSNYDNHISISARVTNIH